MLFIQNKYTTKILGVVFVITMAACVSPDIKMRHKVYCYSPTTNFNSILQYNGYYEQTIVFEREIGNFKKVIDTVYRRMLFYPDGIIINEFDPKLFESKNRYYVGNWGSYIIKDDTIKIHLVFTSVYDGFVWYVIKDKYTLREIVGKIGRDITSNDIKAISKPTNLLYESDFIFRNYYPLPNPDLSWIKNKKWFWCNEQEFKKWRKKK